MLCQGCKWCMSKTIPEFKDDEELADFWARHDPVRFGLPETRVNVSPKAGKLKKLTITMLLDPWMKAALIEQAEKRSIGYQTLARMWLAERLQAEQRQ